MRGILAALALALASCNGCGHESVQPPPKKVDVGPLTRVVDDEMGVVCWYMWGPQFAAMSCIPVTQIPLTKRP